MEQRKSNSDGQSGAPPAATTPPAWMRRAAPYSPDRRAKMLEHMARARSVPQPQAAKATEPSRMSGWDVLRDAYGCAVLSAIIAFFLQSRVPFYLGAFIFLTDGERIESALGRKWANSRQVGSDILAHFHPRRVGVFSAGPNSQ
jgi:hypothetical protein